jgi:hypothetical protein
LNCIASIVRDPSSVVVICDPLVNGAFVALKITVCAEPGADDAVTVPAESFAQFATVAHDPLPFQYDANKDAIPNVNAVLVAVKL